MSRRFSFVLLNLFAVFVASILVPIAHADQWDKATIVTFTNPVEVPGRVLPAGSYVFKIANTQDRRVVQIFTKNERKVLATIEAVPDYRAHATDKPAISFEERPSGEPEALRSWFYPGENYGVHFVYPKSTRESDTEVAGGVQEPPAIVPPENESIAPMVSELTAPPVLPVLAKQEAKPEVLGENVGPQPTHTDLSMLPKTAGNYLMLPLLGLLFLGSGSAILRIRRTASQTSKS